MQYATSWIMNVCQKCTKDIIKGRDRELAINNIYSNIKVFLRITWCQWLTVELQCLNPDEFCLQCAAVSSLYQHPVASSGCSESWRLWKLDKGFKVEFAGSAWERKTSNAAQSALPIEHSRVGSRRQCPQRRASPQCDAFAGVRTRFSGGGTHNEQRHCRTLLKLWAKDGAAWRKRASEQIEAHYWRRMGLSFALK